MMIPMEDPRIRAIAEAMIQDRLLGFEQIPLGGNNRLFRLETTSGPRALKFYRRSALDPRDRQKNEAAALTFFAKGQLPGVPNLLAVDRKNGCSLLEWIEGVPVGSIGLQEIQAALRWVEQLKNLGRCHPPEGLDWASAACRSGTALEGQVKGRRAQLEGPLSDNPDLARFLQELDGTMVQRLAMARVGYEEAGLDFSSDLSPQWRIPSPSDFGFHNALRRANGELVFLDFEYFGWDDPVKLTADFLLHPGMNLMAHHFHERDGFLHGMIHMFRDDPVFLFRLESLFPLFGLCWILILLNEFIPEGWRQRAFSGSPCRDRLQAQTEQLGKAKALLNILHRGNWRLDVSDFIN